MAGLPAGPSLFNMEINELMTDPKLERDGVWIEFDSETSFKIASAETTSYLELIEAKLKPFRSAKRSGTFDHETRRRLSIEAIAEGVLLDWKGVNMGGKPLPFTRDNAILVLSRVKEVLDFVSNSASDLSNFRAKEIQEGIDSLKKS